MGTQSDRQGEPGAAVGALEALAASRLGQVVGDRFRLESVIGVGGTASVYAAVHRNGRRAALKVLHPELARDARSRKRFLREAYAANRVGHPGAVAVIDDGELPDGTPFLLLELISGTNLAELSKDGSRLPVSEVVAIGAAILDVLAAAHDAGVVHRDIKPSNVIVAPDRRIKVLDFGIAKFHDARDSDPLLTRSEVSLGTPAFMSPEQSAGRSAEVDARSDLWSVGATLFSLLTGSFVHSGNSSNELLIASATVPARSITSLRGDLPPHVASAIDRALLIDRANRWPNARAMKAALIGMPDENQVSVITIPERSDAPRGPKGAVPLLLVAGGTLALVLGGLWVGRGAISEHESSAETTEGARAPLSPPTSPVALLSGTPAAVASPLPTSSSPRVNAAPSTGLVSSARKLQRSPAPTAPTTPPSAALAPSARPRMEPSDALFDRRQ
jgi:eukaryotic-like serine/threonine-protein kinase